MNDKKRTQIFIGVIGILIIGLGALALLRGEAKVVDPSKYDNFAMCLKDKGAVFYGAFWCPHCQAQKRLFGASQKLLPYVECSTPDGQAQTPMCIEKKIESYPTWEFADGSRLTGEVSLEELAAKTACELPAETPAP